MSFVAAGDAAYRRESEVRRIRAKKVSQVSLWFIALISCTRQIENTKSTERKEDSHKALCSLCFKKIYSGIFERMGSMPNLRFEGK